MLNLYYIITYIFSYFSILLFLIICIYRFFTWQSAPKNLEWALFPLPEKFIDKVLIMGEEILFMKLIFKNNRRLWFQSLILHYGFYLLIIWTVLTLIGISVAMLGIIACYLMLIGSILLCISRLLIKDIKLISHFNQFFNLFFIIFLSFLFIYSDFFNVFNSSFFYSILLFDNENIVLGQRSIFYFTMLMTQIFLVYVPSSSMVHFFAKYFTWDKIRWGGH